MKIRGSEFGAPFHRDGEWGFNRHEDGLWNNTTTSREWAIGEAQELYGDQSHAYVAEVTEAEVGIPEASEILERIAEYTYDDHGPFADEFLQDVTKEAEAELDEGFRKLVGEWMTKHDLWPKWYSLGTIEKIQVKEEP
jgi:hypothetical protein